MGKTTRSEKDAAATPPAGKKAAPAGPATKATTVVYVGPNLPSGGINHGQVFKGGLPPALESVAAENPAINKLIIPIADLPQAKRDLADPATALAKAFRAAGDTGENVGV